MDQTAKELLRYLIHITDSLAQTVFIGVPQARESIQPEIEALKQMVEEERAPTQAEWEAHDASMEDLRNRLHGP